MKNTGVIRKIDELGRIVVPKEIRKNLGIKSGEDVQIYIEEDKIILKKYQKMLSLKELSDRYLLKIRKLTNNNIIVTDKEKIILDSLKKYDNVKIDDKIENYIIERKQITGEKLKISFDEYSYFYLIPIISDADAIGSIIMVSDNIISDKDTDPLDTMLNHENFEELIANTKPIEVKDDETVVGNYYNLTKFNILACQNNKTIIMNKKFKISEDYCK